MQFRNDTGLRWNNFNSFNYTESLVTQMETPSDYDDRIGHTMSGWFVAPETTQYRFHMTCDDNCEFYMGLNTSDPLTTTHLMTRNGWTSRRYFFNQLDDKTSIWLNLTKGQQYYIYGRMFENYGGDHFAVGVEINQTAIENHHHAIKEVQYIEMSVKDPRYDTTRITVQGANNTGSYYLSFQDPADLSYQASEEISVTASAGTFKNKVKGYYWSKFRSDIDVNLTMF